MPGICFYFQVHQPYRVKRYSIFDVGRDHDYFNGMAGNLSNKNVLNKVATKCYLPANETLYRLLKEVPEFKISYSISGVFLEQLEEFAPEVLHSFQKLVDTGKVELLSETYYHSLSFLYSKAEFERQVMLHRKKIKKLFGVTPQVFRNTELIYNNDLAQHIEGMGYKGIIAEGADHVLGWRSPNFLYQPEGTEKIALLLKDYKLSDDIAFRFSSREWKEFPLGAEKYSNWISAKNGNADVINLFMDYETFGEHQWEDTGIFHFLKALPRQILRHPDNYFITPTEAVESLPRIANLSVPHFMSWADVERDLSAWRSNGMQEDTLKKIFALEHVVLSSGNEHLINDWRKLQTSDHFYYMCTKWFSDGDVHKYFNPYETPYDAFIAYSNVLEDMRMRIANEVTTVKINTSL